MAMPVHLRLSAVDDESPLLNLFDEAVLWVDAASGGTFTSEDP